MIKNNKGFMLVEVIIAATVVLTALVAFYSQFDKLYAKYNERNNFHDINSLYASKTIFNYLLTNENYNFNTYLSDKFDENNYNFIIKNSTICNDENGTCAAICTDGTEACTSLKKSIQQIINFYHVKNMVISSYDSTSLDINCNNIRCENLKCDALTGEDKTRCLQAKSECEEIKNKCKGTDSNPRIDLKAEINNQTFKDYIDYLIDYYDLQNSWENSQKDILDETETVEPEPEDTEPETPETDSEEPETTSENLKIDLGNDYNYLIITEIEENNKTYYSNLRIR